jgi:4-hydroxythreonine-4-phosphate dehydrogenase
MSNKIIGLTPGSELGVGPQLMIKALLDPRLAQGEYFWCGDKASLELAAKQASQKINFLSSSRVEFKEGLCINFLASASPNTDNLSRQAWFLKQAALLGLDGTINALVTGPINKHALKYLGAGFTGQTEYFAQQWPVINQKPLMAFMGGPFILSLMTTHVPLKDVAKNLTIKNILEHMGTLAKSCARLLDKNLAEVKIHVLGLNPHAGEQGLLGKEEQEIIEPAIKMAQDKGILVEGCFAPDGYFAYFHGKKALPDALIAMYHDQGLIAYKLLSHGASVNVTLGLAIPRTSPAHGTANDLVYNNQASPESTINAILSAQKLAGISKLKTGIL